MKNNNTLLGVNTTPSEPVKFDFLPHDKEPSVIFDKGRARRILFPDFEDKEFEHYEVNNKK